MAEIKKKITLGSGKLYVLKHTGTIPEHTVIETDVNMLGDISGGATLTYTPKFYTCSDDLGTISKTFVTEEEVILKSGIMTWTGATLAKLSATARVTEDALKRTIKIGGAGNYDGTNYVIRFVHKPTEGGECRVTLVGNNQAGFEMAFAKDKETIINAEFKAMPMDGEGTQVIYEETFPK